MHLTVEIQLVIMIFKINGSPSNNLLADGSIIIPYTGKI